jgi:hypothetical protein
VSPIGPGDGAAAAPLLTALREADEEALAVVVTMKEPAKRRYPIPILKWVNPFSGKSLVYEKKRFIRLLRSWSDKNAAARR